MDWKQITLGLIVGAVLGIAGTFFLFQGRVSRLEATIESSKTESPASQVSNVTPFDLRDRYNIKIESVTPDKDAKTRLRARGSFSAVPENESVHLFYVERNNLGYWHQSEVKFDSINRFWTGEVYVSENPPKDSYIMVAIVGKCGKALIDYFHKVGRETRQYPSMDSLTDDISECDRFPIISN